MKKILNVMVFLLICGISSALGQKYSIEGNVYDHKKREPLYYATVNIKGTQNYDLTDKKGHYQIKNLLPGKYTLVIRLLGFQEIEKQITIKKSVKKMDFYLKETSLALKDIVVTAKGSMSNKGSTTYKIGSEAVKQVQPVSVKDILQLLPGAKIEQSKMSSPTRADIRNVGGYSALNSFGTAVIVDGNQLSNDGNMDNFAGAHRANQGIDLRQISASNIESVEVVSGVASAKYGNITSGAILIKRKAGYTPWNINFNTDASTYQGSIGKGFKLKSGGFLNFDADYAYSKSDPASIQNFYQRINFSTRMSKRISEKKNWDNNLAFTFGYSFDGERDDPDQQYRGYETKNRSYNLTLSNSGGLDFWGRTNYSFSLNYTHNYTFKDEPKNGPLPIIESLESSTYITRFSPISFFQRTESYGEPVNINARLDNEKMFKFLGMKHNLNLGLEFTYNKNFGKGLVLDEENKTGSSFSAGQRNVNFHEVPASTTYSAYMQNDMSFNVNKAFYLIKLGLRYDYMLEKYNLLSPRLSMSAKYFDKLRLRAAYGISYKAPSMLQLYPGPHYYDIINLNHYSEDAYRSFAVVTTTVHQPTNDHLDPSKGTTAELGFDFDCKGFNLRVTAFYKKIEDGIANNNIITAFDKHIYEAVNVVEGQEPEVAPTGEVIPILEKIPFYNNTITARTKGIEATLGFPRINPTNTDINVSGSFMRSVARNSYNTTTSSFSTSGSLTNRYGAFKDNPRINYVSRANVNITQHVPSLKMLCTFIGECNLVNKSEISDRNNIYPVGYYEQNGTYHALTPEEAKSEAYEDLHRDPVRYVSNPQPFHFNLHFRLRKEMKGGHSFSFYANNFLWYNPTYINQDTKAKTYLNSKISFGLGVNFKL